MPGGGGDDESIQTNIEVISEQPVEAIDNEPGTLDYTGVLMVLVVVLGYALFRNRE